MAQERAVFYARVSTEEENQVNALTNQIKENKDTIEAMSWNFVGQYVDEGKSGTKIKGRNEYQRLYEDIELDKFDIIVIKSQDRLMRNVKDWYLFVDRLVSNRKKLYMYVEHKFYTPDDELITGIRAIIAAEFSRDLSKKICNHYKKMIEDVKMGRKVKFPLSKTLGLRRVNDEIQIVDSEAEIVRLIYKLYLDGYGTRNILRTLTENGYRTRAGKEFSLRAILTILKNERYVGNVILNKTVKDYDHKEIIKNPKNEWVYLYGVIPSIVSQEDFDKVQAILESKRQENNAEQAIESRGLHRGKTPLSGKIYCGECGGKLHRDHNAQAGITYWRCGERNAYGKKDAKVQGHGCDLHRVRDEVINLAVSVISTRLTENTQELKADMLEWLTQLKDRLQGGKDIDKLRSSLDAVNDRKGKLLDLYLDGVLGKGDYAEKRRELDTKIEDLEKQIQTVGRSEKDVDEVQQIIDNIDVEINEIANNCQRRYDWVISNIKKIVVFKDVIEVEMSVGRKYRFEDVQNVRNENPDAYRVYRTDTSCDDPRAMDDISQQELKNAVCKTLQDKGTMTKDALVKTIRTMGFGRSGAALVNAVERGIKYGRKTGEIIQDADKRIRLPKKDRDGNTCQEKIPF